MKRNILSASLCVPALLAGQVRQITPKTYYHTFSRAHPALDKIRPGEVIATKTIDAGGQDERGVWVSQPSNPQTGPFYVEGAQPGDALAVRIRKLRMNRNFGWCNYRLLLNSLTPEHVEGIYSDHYKQDLVRKGRNNLVPWDIDLAARPAPTARAFQRAAETRVPGQSHAGVHRRGGPGRSAPPSGISGPHGGNLDYNEIREGATVILPVYHPGALLFVGDGHALQGDGSRWARASRPPWTWNSAWRCAKGRASRAARGDGRGIDQHRQPTGVCQLPGRGVEARHRRHGSAGWPRSTGWSPGRRTCSSGCTDATRW